MYCERGVLVHLTLGKKNVWECLGWSKGGTQTKNEFWAFGLSNSDGKSCQRSRHVVEVACGSNHSAILEALEMGTQLKPFA